MSGKAEVRRLGREVAQLAEGLTSRDEQKAAQINVLITELVYLGHENVSLIPFIFKVLGATNFYNLQPGKTDEKTGMSYLEQESGLRVLFGKPMPPEIFHPLPFRGKAYKGPEEKPTQDAIRRWEYLARFGVPYAGIVLESLAKGNAEAHAFSALDQVLNRQVDVYDVTDPSPEELEDLAALCQSLKLELGNYAFELRFAQFQDRGYYFEYTQIKGAVPSDGNVRWQVVIRPHAFTEGDSVSAMINEYSLTEVVKRELVRMHQARSARRGGDVVVEHVPHW